MRRSRSSGLNFARRPGGLVLALALGASAWIPMTATQAAEPGTLERVSVANGANGAERNRIETGSTTGCAATTVGKCTKRTIAALSGGGYRVVFSSRAPNLVANDTNGVADVFYADVVNNQVTTVVRASTTAAGAQAEGGDSEGAAISPDGSWIAFESKATNLATGDNKLAADVFVKRVSDGALFLASRANGADGISGNQQSFSPSVANDGSVSFTSFATNLVPSGQVPAFQAVYVRRDPAGAATTEIASVNDGNVPADGPSLESSISGNGQLVAFTSGAKTMGGGATDTTPDEDIFVRDVNADTTLRITRDAKAFVPSISPDGTKVAFASERDLSGGSWIPGDGRKDIYVASVSATPSPSLKSDCSGCADPAIHDRPAVAPSVDNAGNVAFQSAFRFQPENVTSEQVWTNKANTVSMVSKTAAGAPAQDVSELASISPDGLAVSFTSQAANLVASDTNGAPDVFFKNLSDGVVTRVSIRPPSTEASGFAAIPTSAPAISQDGNLVAFESDSTNLVTPDENGQTDIFLRDRAAGTTSKITVGLGGAESDGVSRNPDMSRDGRYIVFESTASNLVDGDANNASDVFLFDRNANSIRRISVSDAGFEATGASLNPAISPNGEWITFESLSSLAPPAAATTDSSQVYRYNIPGGVINRVSLSAPGAGGTRRVPSRDSYSPDVADNGAVVFLSEARNLTAAEECGSASNPCDPTDPNYQAPNRTDVFLADPSTNVITRVNMASNGGLANNDSSDPSISADGSKVAFASAASNLAPDSNTDADVFLATAGGSVQLVSIGAGGATPNGRSSSPSISADGTLVAFVSTASNLVPDDNLGKSDIFLASPGAITRRISIKTDGTPANGDSFTPAVAANGNAVAFQSLANNLADNDNNNSFDAFVRDLLASDRPIPCTSNCGPGGGGPGGTPSLSNAGYRFVAADGGIFSFKSEFYGSMGAEKLNKPIVAMAATPNNAGYWLVASDGGIFSYGNAAFHGSTGAIRLNSPIVSMTATPTGNGYWFVAADGGIFSFGDAKFFGSMGGKPLNRPIVGMASTVTGNGYWLVASDGGIFSFGDAKFFGSTGNIALNKPIVGMDRTASGNGYRFVASDGGIFSFGDASFLGSMGGSPLNKPIVGMAKARVGDGYWLVASDGGIFSYGAAQFHGSTGAIKLNSPIVGMAG